MPHNAVLEVEFSDVQSSNGQPGGLLTLVFTATGGESSFQNDTIINASVVSLSRDGLEYAPVETFSATAKKEYNFNSETGTISFHPELPEMVEGEDSVLQYIPLGNVAVSGTEPVTLVEAKNWLKVDVDDDDTIISALIIAARQTCEGYTALSFVARTVTAIIRNELGSSRLPYGPVNSIISMYDSDDNEIDEEDYSMPGDKVKRVNTPVSCWLKITYTAGYVVLPQQLKTGILEQLAWIYQHRGDEQATQISPVAKIILQPYRAFV